MRGDTLWGISGSMSIYENPFMWPLLHRANRDQIQDPDLIFSARRLPFRAPMRRKSPNTAVRRARTRGPWRLGDGPDYYMLEGVGR
ncbi:hypothetical protein NKDENANG_02286 [Candidatus Entotheonellaceae bacterium PAL068K]